MHTYTHACTHAHTHIHATAEPDRFRCQGPAGLPIEASLVCSPRSCQCPAGACGLMLQSTRHARTLEPAPITIARYETTTATRTTKATHACGRDHTHTHTHTHSLSLSLSLSPRSLSLHIPPPRERKVHAVGPSSCYTPPYKRMRLFGSAVMVPPYVTGTCGWCGSSTFNHRHDPGRWRRSAMAIRLVIPLHRTSSAHHSSRGVKGGKTRKPWQGHQTESPPPLPTSNSKSKTKNGWAEAPRKACRRTVQRSRARERENATSTDT